MPNQDKITGTIERITYYNPENGYSVIKIMPDDDYPEAVARDGTLAVVGIMPELVEGETVACEGRWVDNPTYGRQFRAETITPVAPKSEKGIIRYLSDMVFGIGDATARKIYDHFGEETLTILDENPMRIYDAPIKKNLADNLVKQWEGNRAERQVMVQLQDYGISSRMAHRIFQTYGNETLTILAQNPYQLADDVHLIGFKKADDIARRMGTPLDSPERLRAGLGYVLGQIANDGHTFAPRDYLIETAQELLGVDDASQLGLILKGQIVAGTLRNEKMRLRQDDSPLDEVTEAIYLPIYYNSEIGAQDRLRTLVDTPSKLINNLKGTHWSDYLAKLAKRNNVALTDQQQSAVQATLSQKVTILTGGPGTGKTTTLRMVIHALEQEDIEYALCSPTGRAAKRLGEATERPASTIHRLLGFQPEGGGFLHDDDNPLEVDVLVVDEASMIDLVLFYSMLKALRSTTHLMLVGDIDQLPSVGAGNVLNDIIASGVAHVTRLNQIFRQDDDSHIILNAHRINEGQQPFTDNKSRDFFFFGANSAEDAQALTVDVVVNRIPDKFGYDPVHDVQVLSPMYRNMGGVNMLNQALQERLNPDRMQMFKKLAGRIFRVGDKVMQTKNNYELDVFNGDIGFVVAFDDDENIMQVRIDDNIIDYSYQHAEDLIHAYCISTHRSQGSEYPVVVMPVLKGHYIMLQRNLLYTAITRAKEMVVLIGQRQAIQIAVSNNKVKERYSGLLPRLRGDVLNDGRLF
jgi:exodeoxyribonuclease V alpha subunit